MNKSVITSLTKTVRTKFANLSVAFIFGFSGVALPVLLSQNAYAANTSSNGFELSTGDWTDTTRVASGTDGISTSASGGSFYAKATNNAFTKWDGYETTFPVGGYTTELDVYLDMAQATGGGTDKRFDFTSAINNASGSHRRDFIFSLGTNPTTAGQWGASVSNTTPGWPLNPGRSPATITDTGWYTLQSNFQDNGSGVLAVTMSIIRVSDQAVVGSWVLSDPTDIIGTTVGGHRYGWFAGHAPDFPTIAIDNATLELNASVPCGIADSSTFEGFANGSVNGQGGWSSTGSYDQSVVDNIYGYPTNGCKSLRLSNAVTTGAFGDQTFSYATANEAGEAASTNGGQSGGIRQSHYEAQFDIASTQTAVQPGLALSVSPDRGDGSRMSYLRFEDSATGINVFFDDVTNPGPIGTASNFNETLIATLDRSAPHTIKFSIDLVDGPSNDVVNIYIDGALAHTGTSWEDYYRYDPESSAEQSPRTIDSLLFRSAGTAAPANSGKGFLFDNVGISTSTPTPTPPVTPPSGGGSGGSGSSSGTGNGGTNTVTGGGRGAAAANFGFGLDAGEVLGITTDNKSNDSDKKGKVKSGSTDKSNVSEESDNAFLGLGWWWIPILIALLALLYFLYRRFRPGEEA